MGRAGSGGGSRGGGGHSSSRRSGSGHRVSSGRSRAGSSSSSSYRRSSHSSSYGSYHGGSHYGGYHGSHRRSMIYIGAYPVLMFVIFIIMTLSVFGINRSPDITKSSYDREKVNVNADFNQDCVIDEIGWCDNPKSTGQTLMSFFNVTGVQPYVVFKEYNASLVSDEDKEAYAENYYNDNISDEGSFLFMYFAEEDADNDVGYMHCVVGRQVTSLMDTEAQNIFWDYIDTYWYSDLSTDDMIKTVFMKTANRIMVQTKGTVDVVIIAMIVFGCLGGLVIIYNIMKAKHKRAREKAKEDERILNTPLNTDIDDATLNKYK